MIRKRVFLIVSILILSIACSDNRWKKIDNTNLNSTRIKYIDFDLALSKYSQDNLLNLIKEHHSSNEILDYLFFQSLSIGNPYDSSFFKSVILFRNDVYISDLENEIDNSIRSKIPLFQENLNLYFTRLSYYLKNKPIPKKIFWLNSLFTSSVFCTNTEIGIGLERYIGSNKSVIKKLPKEQFYQWMKNGMRSEFLERDVIVNWIFTHYVPDNSSSLIEKMIQWGKIYYIVYACNPSIESNILLRYDKTKYDWCEQNEEQIWKYIVTQSLVFSKNERDINNFVNDGPFTPGLPEKGPDRVGQYIGWKMVSSFMENHSTKSLEDLLKTSYNSILQEYQID